MIVADFDKVIIGDEIKNLDGVVEVVDSIIDGLIGDIILTKTMCFNNSGYEYIGDSQTKTKKTPTVFYNFPDQFPKEEHCRQPRPKIDVDQMVLVWSEEYSRFFNAHFKSWMTSGAMSVYPYGSDSWSNRYPSVIEDYKYWKTNDGEYNSGNLKEINQESK